MIKLIFIYVTDNHLYFCMSLYGTSHLSLCIVTARHGNIIESGMLCLFKFIMKYITGIIYIVVRHYMMFYASRITFCIVVRHCMMCHAFDFDDSTLYCVLFHVPHFYFVDVVYITPLLMCGTHSTHSCLVHGED